MDESQSSHRLLRRLALLAAIHGFNLTAVGAHLHAADHSSATSRANTALTIGKVPQNPFPETVREKTTQQTARAFASETALAVAPVAFSIRKKTAEAEPVPARVPMNLPKVDEAEKLFPVRLPLPPEKLAPPAEFTVATTAQAASAPVQQLSDDVPMRLPEASTAKPVATRLATTEPNTALAAMSQSTPPWIQPHLELQATEAAPIETTMNVSKLREMARESLREAHSRLNRDATHSAHKIANEALELLVAIADARDGGTLHARQLESAMNAIRESKDFWSTRGPIDQETLVRSVAVHETKVLNAKSLSNVSSLQATSAYLGYAKEQLALAAQSVPEASEAFVLLGQIEKRLAEPTDPHAAAVSLTMHRAAVTVDPSNGYCRRELGKVLLHQGLNEEALDELKIANNILPTRSGFQALREAALRVGDDQLASRCITAMNDSRLALETPVYRLPPEQFAATHRPNATDLSRNVKSTSDKAATERSPQVTDKKSWFPFGRR